MKEMAPRSQESSAEGAGDVGGAVAPSVAAMGDEQPLPAG